MEVIPLQPDLVVVVRYSCSARAEKIAAELGAALEEEGYKARVVQADPGECNYWDGTATAIVSASPLGFPTTSAALAAPLVYAFTRPEDVMALARQVGQLIDARRGEAAS